MSHLPTQRQLRLGTVQALPSRSGAHPVFSLIACLSVLALSCLSPVVAGLLRLAGHLPYSLRTLFDIHHAVAAMKAVAYLHDSANAKNVPAE